MYLSQNREKFKYILSDLSEAVSVSPTMLFDGWLFLLPVVAQAKNNMANNAIRQIDILNG